MLKGGKNLFHPEYKLIRKNIGANYIGAVIRAVLPLITLPIYLSHFGIQNWGIVSFIIFFVSAMSILDAGISQALVKEFASFHEVGKSSSKQSANLLFSYERLYRSFAVFIVFLTALSAGFIVNNWMSLGSLPFETGIWAIYCACAIFIFQFSSSIYRTILLAHQEQVLLNQIQTGFLIIRQIIGVVLAILTGSVWVYLVWQAFSVAIEATWMYFFAWRSVGLSRGAARWDGKSVKLTLSFVTAMGISVLFGAATTMVDKFYVSSKLSISILGYYSIALSISFGVLSLSYPVFNAFLPQLVKLQKNRRALMGENINIFCLIIGGLLISGVLYFLIGRSLLLIWLKSEIIVDEVYPILNILLISSALNVVYNLGYTNWVASGSYKLITSVNAISFLLALFITPLMIDFYGVIGAGIALIIINIFGATLAIIWLTRSFFRNQRFYINNDLP